MRRNSEMYPIGRSSRINLKNFAKKEVEKMAERIYAARLLLQGKTYTQVIGDADISSATLSRVSRCVQYGTGYVKALGEDGMKA